MSTSIAFQKRTYTIPTFRVAVADALDHLPELKSALRAGRISRAFAERLMLAVTQVNRCRYCHYGHVRAALRAGVTPQQIEHLVAGDMSKLPENEQVALVFAQHYAESGERPDREAWQQVVDTYGSDMAREIMALIRMITIGNLSGNTLDALIARLMGRPAAHSTLRQELGVVLGAFLIVPWEILKWRLSRI